MQHFPQLVYVADEKQPMIESMCTIQLHGASSSSVMVLNVSLLKIPSALPGRKLANWGLVSYRYSVWRCTYFHGDHERKERTKADLPIMEGEVDHIRRVPDSLIP